jgi:hypothetical protein
MTKRTPPASFQFAPWRHGGWYVDNVQYASGAIGCVSNNYTDKRWRIVCDGRPGADQITYATREAAAMAEWHLAEQGKATLAADQLKADMLAALKLAEPVCIDALADAELLLEQPETDNGPEHTVKEQNRDAAKAALDAVQAAIARATAD